MCWVHAAQTYPQHSKGNNSKHPKANILGVCLFLCYILGILYQILQRYLRVGAKFSPHRISPFQISHAPNPPTLSKQLTLWCVRGKKGTQNCLKQCTTIQKQ